MSNISLQENWVHCHLQFEAVDEHLASSPGSSEKVRIVSWNILANQYRGYHYNGNVNLEEHARNPLWRMVLQRFMELKVDFICLQEVDVKVALQTLKKSYTRLLTPTGHGHGDTRVDACCIFYRTEKWTLCKMQIVEMDELATMESAQSDEEEPATRMRDVRDSSYEAYQKAFRRNNFGIIAKFKHRSSEKSLVISNTHLYWNPEFEYVKLCQAHYFVLQMQEFCSNEKQVPLVLCGDLNSKPASVVHTYLTKGQVLANTIPSPRIMGLLEVEKWLENGSTLTCPFQFKSSYAHSGVEGTEEPPFTNVTADFVGTLDYIFYQPEYLVPVKRLYLPRSLNEIARASEGSRVLPSKVWPSNHLAVGVDLAFK